MEGVNYLFDGINILVGILGVVKMVQELCFINIVLKFIEYFVFG